MSSKKNLSPTRTRVLALFALTAFVSVAVTAGTSSAALFGRLLPVAQSGPAMQPAVMSAAAAPAPLAAAPDEEASQEPAFITTDRTDYNPGETVVITGSSFQPHEAVTLSIKREGVHAATLQATADENGNIYNNQFVIGADDFGASFELIATGATSGKVANSKFTDGTMSYSPVTQAYIGAVAIVSSASQQTVNFSQTVIGAPGNPNDFTVVPDVVRQSDVEANITYAALPSNYAVTFNPTSISYCNGAGCQNSQAWTVTVTIPANVVPVGGATLRYAAIVKAMQTSPTHANLQHNMGAGTRILLEIKAPTPTDTTAPTTTVDSGGYVHNSWTNQDVSLTLTATDNVSGTGVKSITYSINGGTPVVTNAASVTLPTFTAQGDYTISYFAIDNANNSEASANKSFRVKIDKTIPVITLNGDAEVTIPFGSAPYADPGAAATDAGGSGLNGDVVVTGAVDTNVVGDYTLSYNVSDNAGNAADTVTRTVHVVKAEQTINFGPLADKTYGDPDFEVNATAGSGEPVSFSASGNCTVTGSTVHLTGAGSCTITASQAGNANYDPAEPVEQSFNIAKADATVSVQGFTGTYDGQPHGATGTATGIGDEDLNSLLNLGDSFTNVPGGTAHWTFAGNDNYNGSNGSVEIVINKADATVSVAGFTGTYDGDPHGATGTAAGVQNEDLSSLLSLGDSFTDVPGGTAHWSFAGNNNYNADSGSVAIVISKANASINVQGVTVIYDGDPHGATGTATGVKGENLSALLNLGATFTDVPGGTANWSFAGNNNYNAESGSVAISISKAPSLTTVTCVGTHTYTGSPITPCSAKVTGAGGLDLTFTPDYADNTNAGTATASYTYGGDTNHDGSSDSESFEIAKANATVNVNGYAGIYDGNAHGATGSATGVNGEDLSSLLDLGDTFTNVPGGAAHWSFAGNNNYNMTSGSVEIELSKADAAISVTGGTFTYNGTARGATGSATGAGGEDLSSLLDLGATFTNVPGGAADWTFPGDNNHHAANGSVEIVIEKANATVVVNGYTGTYDGQPHGASGTATGAGGEDLSSLLNLGASFTNAPGGAADWTFPGDGNHHAAQGTASIVINQKGLTITASSPADITYGDAAPAVTPIYAGFIPGEDASHLTTAPTCGTAYAAGSNAGSYATTCSGAAAVNYSISYVAGSLKVNPAPLMVKADDKSKIFDGTPFTAFTVTYTGFVLGQNQSVLGGALSFTTDPLGATMPGTYTINPGGLTSSNYAIAFSPGTLTIASWTMSGFYQPVDMSPVGGPMVVNTIKGGSTVPLKFEIFAGTTEKQSTSDIQSFQYQDYPCGQTATFESPIEVTTTGGTSLRYDTTAGQFIQNWQTPKTTNKCYQVRMTAKDGSAISAYFKTK